jgi:hypothetical protein
LDNTKIFIKISDQIKRTYEKLDSVSGVYLTNTPKRQKEQRERDRQKEQYRQRLELLIHLRGMRCKRDLTPFELTLLTGTVYEEIRKLAIRHQHNTENPANRAEWVNFHNLDSKLQKVLIKAGISDNDGLYTELVRLMEIIKMADPKAERIRDLIYAARNRQGGDIQFTPEPIAKYLVSLAGIDENSKVLEPEAGIASIADIIKGITTDVDCVEYDYSFREILEFKGHNIVARDLFEHKQNPVYDAVIMNPPFSAEIKHIKYAFGFLKPGGVLVAVCSSRFNYVKNRGYPEFRDWLERHGLFYENAEGKFEKSGIASMILRIKRSAELSA